MITLSFVNTGTGERDLSLAIFDSFASDDYTYTCI